MMTARPAVTELNEPAPLIGWGTRLEEATGMLTRRLGFALPVFGAAAGGTWLAAALTAGVPGMLRPALLLLLFGNLLYLAMTGWPSVMGGLLRLVRPARPLAAEPNGTSRTAVLFPIYHEEPGAVFAAVEVMARALLEHDVPRTDLFVLSDTRDEATAAAEAALFARLPYDVAGRVRYRRRPINARRKVGNIAEFCSAWHLAYDYMVVLDADSLMGAATIRRMIGLMDANPRTGLIQTVPYATGRQTLFARIQQFSARLYTPLLVEGLTFWQQGDANYWGHNAIIRIAPFMAHCDLPVLPGRQPFGGEILCHDVVEAGLMRRGGWQVWMLPSLDETYEALPANLTDYAMRERRWCQGNLQHLAVLGLRGLRPVGRYHLALGILSYLSGPLLVGFAGLAMVDAALDGGFARALLAGGGAGREAFMLLVFLLLYAAKLCSLAAVLADARQAALFGGRLRLLASAAVEQACAMVTAPVLHVFYTAFVVKMLLGRTVQWNAQPRDDRGVGWAEALRRMWLPGVVGFAWLAAGLAVGGPALGWSLALIPGLLLAAPVTVWTSRLSWGLWARRAGLLLTEDEQAPSSILRAYQRASATAELPSDEVMCPAFEMVPVRGS